MLIVSPDKKNLLIMENQDGFSVSQCNESYSLIAYKNYTLNDDCASERIVTSEDENYIQSLLDFIIKSYVDGYDVLYLPKEGEEGISLYRKEKSHDIT